MTRYYGWYANRTRGVRKKLAAGSQIPDAPVVLAEREDLSLREARRRWAELLRKVFEVDPLKCPGCGGGMRIISFITRQNLIDQIQSRTSQGNSRARSARPSCSSAATPQIVDQVDPSLPECSAGDHCVARRSGDAWQARLPTRS
jgi:hypothetical protein